MKTTSTLIATGVSALAFVLAAPTPARADIKEAARKLHDESQAALVGIKGLLKIDVTMNGQPAGNQESPIWGNGLVIGDGLVATAYQTLVPDVAAQAKGGGAPAGIDIKTNLAEVKFVDGAGEEFDAKLILHDEDLDLAFLALDPNAENADAWEIGAVGITYDPEVEILEDVIGLSRQSATLRFASALKIGSVTSVVKRPRLLYAVNGISPGSPAFSADGSFLGMVTLRKSTSSKQQPVPVILPAKYLRKLVPQAVEKQEELASGGGDEDGGESEDDAVSDAPAGESTPSPEGDDAGSEENEAP
ncbi:MAG: trypsin-like peptidase domain-containing protein [Verrucomicrobiales bacterium]